MNRTPAALAGILLLTACGDSTGPRIPDDLSGVWVAVVHHLGEVDTLRLLLPEASDSFATAFSELGGLGAFGVVSRTPRRVSGTLGYFTGYPWIDGLTIDLTRLGNRLTGTLDYTSDLDSAQQVSFGRYAPGGPNVAGTWITSSVVSPDTGTVYLDTLIIKSDGRVQLAASLSAGGFTNCAVSGMRGVYRFEDGRLILGYVTYNLLPYECAFIRLVDTLTLGENTLTRTRHYSTGDLIETLTRQ